MRLLGAYLALFALAQAVYCATADEWRSRSIYQVMTDRFSRPDGSLTAPCDCMEGLYCGGTWQGIINQLDYIQNMGFSAVWISPVNAQVPGNTTDKTAYHGYWPQDLYALNDAFGTEADLLDLSNALHDRDMFLMVDVVPNHMAIASSITDVDYSLFRPFDNASYFHHPYCNVDEEGASQIECWLGDDVVPLVDLKTEDESVQSFFNEWISEFVQTYSIDGLRIDSSANINTEFFPGFCKSAGVFCMGEVYSDESDYVCTYQQVMDSTLNYPIYWTLTQAFSSTNGSLQNLAEEMHTMEYGCKDTTLLGSFSEDHDVPRFASHNDDLALAKNVLVYTMLADGIPIVYQGQEQHFRGGENPLNREALWPSHYTPTHPLYTLLTTLNTLRTDAISTSQTYTTYRNWVISNDTLANNTLITRKGYPGSQIIQVLTNDGSSGPNRSFTLDPSVSGLQGGEVLLDVVSCTVARADEEGWLEVEVGRGEPRVFYGLENLVLAGSGVCGMGFFDGVLVVAGGFVDGSKNGSGNGSVVGPTIGPEAESGAASWMRGCLDGLLTCLLGLTMVQWLL